MTPFDPVYRCPVSRESLSLEGDFLVAAGGARYPHERGVPSFLSHAPVEDEATVSSLKRLNEVARQKDWKTAVHDVYGEGSGMAHYVTRTGRGSFTELLDLKKTDCVLEVGPGLGQFTVELAARSAVVYGLEIVPGQAEFALERCRQEGRTNVHMAAGGDEGRLPYADGVFDVVVMNLVFEWCPSRGREDSPEAFQERLLRELLRVLKPGGRLFIATKNRFSLRYLVGRHDEHWHGLRFGSVLPVWLARFFLRLSGRPSTRARLHSYGRLRRMLFRSGFSDVLPVWASPDARFPDFYAPVPTNRELGAARRRATRQEDGPRLNRLISLLPDALFRRVMPGLVFLARR